MSDSEHASFTQRCQHAGAESAKLPVPTADALTHSEKLIAVISEEIASQGGQISFARFMELALYAPGLGYYSAGCHKFGESGDFITAPEISSLFARCVARAIKPVLENLNLPVVLEAGAGTGTLAAGVLLELERLGCIPERYLILELSGDLQARQKETLVRACPHLIERVQWLDYVPEALRAVVVANELLDAMPVRRFVVEQDGLSEQFVCRDGNAFLFRNVPVHDEVLIQRIELLRSMGMEFAPGYLSEAGFAAERWLRTIAEQLEQGLVLLIDYGFPAHEFYHAQRSQGTLMCHYRHRAHPDPLLLVGLQDITAHVDFSAIARAGVDAGLELYGYTNQANFLIGSGLTELATEVNPVDVEAQMKMATEIKKLTLPHEMGELFKVIAFRKQVDVEVPGFQIRNLKQAL